MTTYRGETLMYQRPVRVATAFASKLEQFERTVARVATRHYGRPPRKILHFGARACRTVRGRGERLSEHALGNAIDVSGFLFGSLRGSERTYSELPAKLQRAFTVSVRRDWEASPSEPPLDRHARFLRDLVEALEENDVFRGIIGPGHRGHEAHLHLDYAPFGYTLLG